MSLVVNGLVKRFQTEGDPVLDGVSFAVPPGSVTCLLGPSGAGKTTVLHIIAGLADADSGTVHLDGSSLDGLAAHRRPFTLLMQQPQLFAHLDVIDNVGFGLRVRGMARRARQRRSRELLELVGVDHLATRSTHHLSGGEQQRVALARALAVEPAVLLADEPFASVDVSVRRDLQDLVTDVHRELGTTMLMVTHDLDEARRITDHCIVLQHGHVVREGRPPDVIGRPTASLQHLPWSTRRHVKSAEPRSMRAAEMHALTGGSRSSEQKPSTPQHTPPSTHSSTTATGQPSTY